MNVRVPRRRVDGVLLLDKPAGLTSNAALQRAKRLYAAQKAGHTGTLDPLATGLLPIAFGEATKLAHALLDAPKGYDAVVRFGTATDTGDAEGEVVRTMPVPADPAAIEAALGRFRGRVTQTPPRHAALKHQGRAYYDWARAGVEIPRPPRDVEIHSLAVRSWAPPDLALAVDCSKGTYIRVLAADIGKALGCGAHLTGLRRTVVGDLGLAGSVTLAELEALDEAGRSEYLQPVDALLHSLPLVTVEGEAAERFRHGNPVDLAAGLAGKIRVYADGRLIGIGEPGADGRLWPKRLVQLAV